MFALLLMAVPLAAGEFRAGAARVDITPPEDAALPMSGYGSRKAGFEGVHDRLNARALVVEDGATQAAILTLELIANPEEFWNSYTERSQL